MSSGEHEQSGIISPTNPLAMVLLTQPRMLMKVCAGSVKVKLMSTLPGYPGILYHIRSSSGIKEREVRGGLSFPFVAGAAKGQPGAAPF